MRLHGDVLKEELVVSREQGTLNLGVSKGGLHPSQTLAGLFAINAVSSMNVAHVVPGGQ